MGKWGGDRIGVVPRSLGRRALLREGLLLHGDATAVGTIGRVVPPGWSYRRRSLQACRYPLSPIWQSGQALACGAQCQQFLPTVKQKMGSWTPRLTTMSAALAYRYNTESTNLRTQIQHESASGPTRPSRAPAPLTEGWAAPPPEAPETRSAPLCPGTVPKHPAYRWGARRSSRPQPWRPTRVGYEAWLARDRREGWTEAPGRPSRGGERRRRERNPPERAQSRRAIGPRVR